MTITLDEEVYAGLSKAAGPRGVSRFIEDLVRPHVLDAPSLEEGYRAMAADADREADAQAWCNGLLSDLATDPSNETR